MAQNIEGLLTLLGSQVLDMDLSFIDASKVVAKDLKHMHQLLQLLMDVVLLIAERQEEEEEEAEADPKAALKKQLDSDKKSDSKKADRGAAPAQDDQDHDAKEMERSLGIGAEVDEMSPGDAQLEMPDEALKQTAIARAVDWIATMQCKPGGWGAFDIDKSIFSFSS